MNKEDRDLARRMAQTDLDKTFDLFREMNIPGATVGYGNDGVVDYGALPQGDGDRLMVSINIGSRGSLSKRRARDAAKVWNEAVRRYPKAFFMISLLGYNEDPREIWEISEAARYVRWWAKYADMDDVATADRFLGSSSAIGELRNDGVGVGDAGMGFLAACGAFGEEIKQQSLAGFSPTSPN